ncbi:pyocin knob domain-containing protein [Bacteroides sp. CG01]|uniref:pyocin knob domain-containing protein n=1 Tax=Bacteroides sp. CG01 TaxID=3096000 RepID=UPI002AFF4BD9|nr:pyocin knob domain-containing protein [Bacteroides sp. CG01]
MKKIIYSLVVFAIPLLSMSTHAQTAMSLGVNDTRNISEPPRDYGEREVKADLKFLTTSGISTAYGFTTNLTISPGFNGTAGYISQLSFNNNGVFYRNGDYFSSSWNGWNKILMSDLSGNVNLENLKVNGSSEFGNELDNTYSTFIIQGPNSPTGEAGKRDIIFNFKYAGQSGIRAFRGDEWGTFLQLMTSQPGDVTGTARVRMHIDQYGKIGIGTVNPSNELDVNGTIRAKEIKVVSDWADFVFKKGYNLPSLKEVKRHIDENGTLPGVPSEKEVKANGVNLAETDVLLLQKIEELTLYIIDLKQEIEDLKSQIKK